MIKKSKGSSVAINRYLKISNLLKSFINLLLENLKKEKFKDNVWGAGLADMQLISKYNKGVRFLLCAIDIFSKYGWIVPLKDKKRCKHCCRISKYFKTIQQKTKQDMGIQRL